MEHRGHVWSDFLQAPPARLAIRFYSWTFCGARANISRAVTSRYDARHMKFFCHDAVTGASRRTRLRDEGVSSRRYRERTAIGPSVADRTRSKITLLVVRSTGRSVGCVPLDIRIAASTDLFHETIAMSGR